MALVNYSEAYISIIDIREEQMVDPTCFNANPNPTRRTAHFLQPSLNPSSTPPLCPKTHSFPVSLRPDNVSFLSCTHPLPGWQTWVQELEATHGLLWRKVGIFDAIKGSTYHINRNYDLILRLVERWCPETNTFVFPWGEATLTLEDVFVLGGFSPLGESVLRVTPLEDNVKEVENKLVELHRELYKIDRNCSYLRWQARFKGCGEEIEHACFLALWLNRHVFKSKFRGITKSVFSMAARLSCGVKVGLGPAVLASIYRDLTLLKRGIVGYDVYTLKLVSPLQFVQVWAWERFPSLGPVPRMINPGETRLVCWENNSRKTRRDIDDIGMYLDSARDTFRWRPYAMSIENCSLSRFYADSRMWVVVDSDDEWKIVARFLLVCQLTGLDCVEGYNPNRVALQFGFDQDIPEYIVSCEPGWLECEKNLKGLTLYIPHRLHEGDVTYRYSNWWNGLNLAAEAFLGCKRKTRTAKRMKKVLQICNGRDESDDFVALDRGGITEKPMEKLLTIEDVSSRHLVQGGSVNEMTCLLNMPSELSFKEGTRMEEERRNEARRNKFPHTKAGKGKCNKYSNAVTHQIQPMTSAETLIEHESKILRNKAAETEQNVDSNPGADCIKPSQILLERKQVSGPDCGQRHLHLVNEAGRVGVTSPLIRQGEGSEKFQHNAGGQDKEETLIPETVMIEESSEYLEKAGKSRNETTECNKSLIGVASEVNAISLIHENDEPDKADTQVHGQVGISTAEENIDLNPFAAFCREYESRISELEREISALSAIGDFRFISC